MNSDTIPYAGSLSVAFALFLLVISIISVLYRRINFKIIHSAFMVSFLLDAIVILFLQRVRHNLVSY